MQTHLERDDGNGLHALGSMRISLKVCFKSVCSSKLPHESVDLCVIIINVKNKLTDLCGNQLLQNDFKNALCEIKALASRA